MRLTLLPEGLTLDCPPGRSLLDAALQAGVSLPHSCRGGACGACRATWVSGEVVYPTGVGLGLTVEEQSQGQLLLCRAMPQSDVTVRVRSVRPAGEVDVQRLPCRVAQWQLLSPDVLYIGLKLPAIAPFRWQAGQSIDLVLADGTRRAYSLAAPVGEGSLLPLHVARVPGGQMSEWLFGLGGPGALLKMEGPFGGFVSPDPQSAESLVLVAGGTGYAPLRSLLRTLSAQEWVRPTRLYWGVRRGADLYADAELRAFADAHPHFRYVPVCEDGNGPADARIGRVHSSVLAEEPRLDDLDLYAAGPTAMVTALRTAVMAKGLPAERFYADAFG